MPTNWFEALDEKDATNDQTVEIPVVAENASDGADPAARSKGEKDSVPSGVNLLSDKRLLAACGLAVAGLVLVPLGGKAAETLFGSEDDAVQAAASRASAYAPSPASKAGPQAPESATEERVEVGSACSDPKEEVEQEDSVRGITSAFQQAYFDRDVERLLETTAEESPLREQDWETLLPEAAPDGTEWCASFGSAKEGAASVELDLMMRPPGQEATVYGQVATAAFTDDGWKLVRIDPREG